MSEAKPIELVSGHRTKEEIQKRKEAQEKLKGDNSKIEPTQKLNENEIRIFNQFNQYKCEALIQRRCDIIYSICELDDDGTIVSCSKDKSIIIGDQIIPKAHFCIICKVICLSGKRIASCSSDRTIKI